MSMSSSASAAHPVIVVGVGDDEASERALQWAVDEAGRGSMSLHLLHASPMPFRASVTAEPAAGARRLLDDAAQRVHDLDPQVEVTTATEHGRASVSLVDAAQGAELLVVGSRARSAFASAVLGSTSLDVAVHAGCPVVPLTVVHAWQLDFAGAGWTPEDSERVRDEVAEQERALAAEAVSGWGEKYPDVELRQVVLNAHPVEALGDHSRDAELVVVGSRGRGGFRGMLLGSVSRDVLGHAHCPVMVVRSAGRS
jgi:nucleotide-binding universal stress UspA family protein